MAVASWKVIIWLCFFLVFKYFFLSEARVTEMEDTHTHTHRASICWLTHQMLQHSGLEQSPKSKVNSQKFLLGLPWGSRGARNWNIACCCCCTLGGSCIRNGINGTQTRIPNVEWRCHSATQHWSQGFKFFPSFIISLILILKPMILGVKYSDGS